MPRLIALGKTEGAIEPQQALGILDKLAETDFRMTVDLYRRARQHLRASTR